MWFFSISSFIWRNIHYFMWQLWVAASYRPVCRISAARPTDRSNARCSCSGKWQTLVVRNHKNCVFCTENAKSVKQEHKSVLPNKEYEVTSDGNKANKSQKGWSCTLLDFTLQ
jgi:hypothetical protein